MALGWRGSYLRYREFFLNVMDLYKKRADLRAFLEIILSLATVIIFLVFALKPTVLTIISLLNEIKEKQGTFSGLTLKVNNLETANNLFTQNQTAIADVDLAVGTNPEPDLIAKQVEGIASKDSVNVLGISVGQVTLIGTTVIKKGKTDTKPLPESADEMPISISIKGDYAGLVSFLKDFENLRVVTNIDSVVINSSVTDTGQVIVAVISGRLPFIGTNAGVGQ